MTRFDFSSERPFVNIFTIIVLVEEGKLLLQFFLGNMKFLIRPKRQSYLSNFRKNSLELIKLVRNRLNSNYAPSTDDEKNFCCFVQKHKPVINRNNG